MNIEHPDSGDENVRLLLEQLAPIQDDFRLPDWPSAEQAALAFEDAPPLHADSRAWLRSQGIPETAIEDITECISGYVSDGYDWHFEINPSDTAKTLAVRNCFHIPVRDNGKFVDLVRFTRDAPRVSHHRHGGRICRSATWIGEPVEPGDGQWAIPTPIWRSPFAWLKANRQGLCYLRLSYRTDRLARLRDLPAIIGEDTAHSLHLDIHTWMDDPKAKPPAWARIRHENETAKYIAGRVMQRINKVAA